MHTSEWLRQVRYYTWQLPEAPDAEQDAANEAMRQVLISALRSGASPVAIGTPAFAAPAAASHPSAEDVPIDADSPGAAARSNKRGPEDHATEPAVADGGRGDGTAKRPRQSSRALRSSVRSS